MSGGGKGGDSKKELKVLAVTAVVIVLVALYQATGKDLSQVWGDARAKATSTAERKAQGVAAGGALNKLAVQPAGSGAGYDRDRFGEAWVDVDVPGVKRNGCDTRSDILRRDLTEVTLVSRSCKVATGVLADPYTAKKIIFNRSKDPDAIQIDHVVPLAEAWRMGASKWPQGRRVQFANDPRNLLAVDGPTNNAKSDKTPAEWSPPNPGYRCEYAIRVVNVHSAYALPVTPDERVALNRLLDTC